MGSALIGWPAYPRSSAMRGWRACQAFGSTIPSWNTGNTGTFARVCPINGGFPGWNTENTGNTTKWIRVSHTRPPAAPFRLAPPDSVIGQHLRFARPSRLNGAAQSLRVGKTQSPGPMLPWLAAMMQLFRRWHHRWRQSGALPLGLGPAPARQEPVDRSRLACIGKGGIHVVSHIQYSFCWVVVRAGIGGSPFVGPLPSGTMPGETLSCFPLRKRNNGRALTERIQVVAPPLRHV